MDYFFQVWCLTLVEHYGLRPKSYLLKSVFSYTGNVVNHSIKLM